MDRKEQMNTGKKILLSISILVSGRGETTEKCIDSLDRLRKRVPCELLLVDTGCPEQMRGWLEHRSDKVIPFAWCNDFSAARNVGLGAASGEWFLFLDDDEWFENTNELEQFFLSGEYKRYEAVSYLQRNYITMEGDRWRDIPLTRMVKRREDTRFVYPIHESLWPIYEPVKYLEDYVHHYGYASPDPEIQKAKRQRNLSLLLPLIQEDPHCLHHYLQAILEYIAARDYEKAQQMAEDGIGNYVPERVDNGNELWGLYGAAVRLRVMRGQYEEARKRGSELLERTGLSRLAETSICGDLAISCGALEMSGNRYGTGCIEYLHRYLEQKKYFELHKTERLGQLAIILDSCLEEDQYRMVMGWGFGAALSGEDAQAVEALLSLEPTSWWMETEQNWYTQASLQYREEWKKRFQNLMDRIQAGQEVQPTSCPRTRELYVALTGPEQGGNEAGTSPVNEQMAALAAQLKVNIRLLIGQGQGQAALAAVKQLLGYFPEDKELIDLQDRLERK